jgi:hypothetical protein
MSKQMSSFLKPGLMALLFLSLALGGRAKEDPTRILFIGNSYTGQIRGILQQFIAASPIADEVEMEFITPGGKNLKFHSQQDATRKKIESGNWDFIVLQDQSQTPAVLEDIFFDGAEELDDLIDETKAQTVFYQTWGRRDGDKHNPGSCPNYKSMQKLLTKNYRKAARKCDALLAPVGEVWSEVREADEQLGLELYKGDGSHPSRKGAFLAATVFYRTLFKQDPAKVPFTAGLSDEEVATIREALRKTIR